MDIVNLIIISITLILVAIADIRHRTFCKKVNPETGLTYGQTERLISLLNSLSKARRKLEKARKEMEEILSKSNMNNYE